MLGLLFPAGPRGRRVGKRGLVGRVPDAEAGGRRVFVSIVVVAVKMPPTQMVAFRIVVQQFSLSRSFVVVCMCPRRVVHARGACRGELGLCRGSKS